MFNDGIKTAGFIMFWRNDERIDDLPLDTQGFYFQLVKLACHTEGGKKFKGTPLKVGEWATSLSMLAERFCITIRQIRTHLKRLTDVQIIDTRSDTRKTVITICNYSTFHQNTGDERHTKRQTNDTPNDKPTTHLIEEERKERKEDSIFLGDPAVKIPTVTKTLREQAEEKGFLELWEAGKNKSNRQSAEKKFLEAIKEVSLDVLVSQRKAYNLDMETKFKGKDVNYQGVDVWLNKRRWEDEYTPTVKASSFSDSEEMKQKLKAIRESEMRRILGDEEYERLYKK
jgi:hypothetical protein